MLHLLRRPTAKPPVNALILSGGGARAAYQVGVLRAVAELYPEVENPFEVICGTSAGAINAAAIAAYPGLFKASIEALAETWFKLEIDQVYRTSWYSLLKGASQIGWSLLRGQKSYEGSPLGLLDSSPLQHFLEERIPFRQIPVKIRRGQLKAISITALGYNTGRSIAFYDAHKGVSDWQRYRRSGRRDRIGVEHLMASSAIPLVFPAHNIRDEYFGDGAMRQVAPISPALHLGADRAFIIGVSGNRNLNPEEPKPPRIPLNRTPSMAQIVGQLFNAAFIDSLEGDIEHLERVNLLLSKLTPKQIAKDPQLAGLKPIDTLIISPSKNIDEIAAANVHKLPDALRFFMRRSGATSKGGGSAAASYLTFTRQYTEDLIKLGFQDAMDQKADIALFFKDVNTDAS